MTATSELLERNGVFAAGFADAELPSPPSLKVAVVTCMDCRLDPAAALGLAPGDAHVIRSLSISQHHLGTEEIVVVHHTKCGLMTFTDEQFAAELERETGQRPQWSAGAFEQLEQDVREGMQRILDSPFIPRKEAISGYVYEVETGRVRALAADR